MPAPPHRMAFSAFGVSAQVASDDLQLLRESAQALPPGWASTRDEAEPCFVLTADGGLWCEARRLARPGEVSRAQQIALLGAELRDHVALNAAPFVFVHAGVVGWRERAIVLPGRSFSGKTTLVAAFLEAGARYLSDEYAVIDGDGMVHPFPKPLSIRRRGSGQLGEFVPVEPHQVQDAPLRAGAVLFARYASGAVWRPGRLSPADAALAILEHTITVRQRPQEAVRAASTLARDAVTYRSVRGPASSVAKWLLSAESIW